MKKISAIVCAVVIMLSSIQGFAYEYPKSFWSVSSKYEAAVKADDYSKTIQYGKQIIDIMSSASNGPEKVDILVTRYNKIAEAYAKLGDYINSAKTYKSLCDVAEPWAQNYGDLYYDYYRGAKAKIAQYESSIKMYTDKGTSTNYGAKNEKGNGVLFGICADGKTRSKLNNESLVLTYQELGQKLLAYNVGVVRNASKSGCAVEFALNCPKEGTDIKNIRKMDSYLEEISDLFSDYPKVPIYLRFAAEFNIWTTMADAEEFKSAFRYVSDYFKDRNDNVAIVWSPNHASNWRIADIDDYYPGDEYVDWVGTSLYAEKYFRGDKNANEMDEIAFKTGINSDPVIAVKEIIEKYGDRKPIMISESGTGHKMMQSGEDTGAFALRRLQEYYSYLPMVYPQIKVMAYFDAYVNSTKEKSDFRLSTNTTLQNEYLELVKGQRFIQDSYSNQTGYCYRAIGNGTKVNNIFEVSCYAHKYGAELKSVTYSIDGKYAGKSEEVPFAATVNATKYTGEHTLKATALFDDGKTITTESKIYINNTDSNITVEISGEEISFDQKPILYNNRTLVPMRKIFEELGATVTWNGDTKTAMGKKGDRTVKISVGQKTMYVNNTKIELDTAPMVLSDRTLVPVRAVAEGLGCTVEWDGDSKLVSITPKTFRWSDWTEELPENVTKDMYYTEEREEYRYRTSEKEYFSTEFKFDRAANYVGEEVSYGEWSGWSDDYVAESDKLEVKTKTESTPKEYHYAHYCTGKIADKDKRYKTWDHKWHEECTYHDLGWFSSPLPYSEDSTTDYAYYKNGKKYKCSNSCFRWYLIETTGGSYTLYNSRPIYREYIYYEWSDWSRWSDWDDDEPDYYYDDETDIDVDERTVYRYKEKG